MSKPKLSPSIWLAPACALALVVTSPSVYAFNWKRLVKTDALSLYVDMTTLERDGDVRRIWEMQDLANPDPNGVRSRRYVNEIDCKQKYHRIGNMTSFSGPKLTGERRFEVEDMGYWRRVPPDGTFAVSYVLLCVD